MVAVERNSDCWERVVSVIMEVIDTPHTHSCVMWCVLYFPMLILKFWTKAYVVLILSAFHLISTHPLPSPCSSTSNSGGSSRSSRRGGRDSSRYREVTSESDSEDDDKKKPSKYFKNREREREEKKKKGGLDFSLLSLKKNATVLKSNADIMIRWGILSW